MVLAEPVVQQAVNGIVLRALRATGRFLLRVPLPLALTMLALWGIVIWDLSAHSVTLPLPPSAFWVLAANLAHAPLFGVFTLFLAAVLLRERGGAWPRPRVGPSALVIASAFGYGVLDEYHQSFTPGRDSSPLDVLTDLVSALLVVWIVFYLDRPGANERGLLFRLCLGIALCVATAALGFLS